MKYKRVLICILPILREIPTVPFVGVGYISEILSSNNIEHIVFDMNLRYSKKKLFQKIEEFKPDLIGFFMMTNKYKFSYSLINEIKLKYNITTIAGGPHVSTFRKKFLEECNIDFGIKLEGEETLIELIDGKNPEEIHGLLYRKDGQVHENPDRAFIKNLDKLQFPKFKKFELNKYRDKAIAIITSRGCPYQCIYCPVKAAIGTQFRARSAENVFNEIKFWYQKGYRKIMIYDDNFTLIKDRVIDICRLIINNNLKDLVLICPNGVRADKIDREILNFMKKAGFMSMAFGVEGGNNKTLKALKKGATIEDIEEKIKLACKMDFDVALFFLIGAPGETEQDVEDSFQLALRYPIVDAVFYSIVPYPQTELYEWVIRENLLINPMEIYLHNASAYANIPYYETEELPYEKRKELIARGKKISKRIRKIGIIRRFQMRYGYIGWIIGFILGSNFVIKNILQIKFFLRLYTKYLTLISN